TCTSASGKHTTTDKQSNSQLNAGPPEARLAIRFHVACATADRSTSVSAKAVISLGQGSGHALKRCGTMRSRLAALLSAALLLATACQQAAPPRPTEAIVEPPATAPTAQPVAAATAQPAAAPAAPTAAQPTAAQPVAAQQPTAQPRATPTPLPFLPKSTLATLLDQQRGQV